jgi:hypothetical protein
LGHWCGSPRAEPGRDRFQDEKAAGWWQSFFGACGRLHWLTKDLSAYLARAEAALARQKKLWPGVLAGRPEGVNAGVS